MKKNFVIATISALMLGMLAPIGAGMAQSDQTERSSVQDRQRYVAIVRKLENAPLDPTLLGDRSWAIAWLTDAPDITVSICSEPLNGVMGSSFAYKAEILVQYMLGMGAFLIENPGKASDGNAQQLAGVESALKAYRAMRIAQPSERSAELDSLLAMQERGALSGFISKAAAKCQRYPSEAM